MSKCPTCGQSEPLTQEQIVKILSRVQAIDYKRLAEAIKRHRLADPPARTS